MFATFIQDDDCLDHIPSADLPAGSLVVLGGLVGIARRPIPAGSLGSLALVGIYDLPVTPGPSGGVGTPVFCDPAGTLVTIDPALIPNGVRCGALARPLLATDTSIRVLLNR